MTMQSDLSMAPEDVLRVELTVFRQQLSDLEKAIKALQCDGDTDQIAPRRLEMQKRTLQNRITVIEDRLTPDIIA